MEVGDLNHLAAAAEENAKTIRRKKGRSRGKMLGPDSSDEQHLDDLADSWSNFGKILNRQAKNIEREEAAMDRSFAELAEDLGRYGSND